MNKEAGPIHDFPLPPHTPPVEPTSTLPGLPEREPPRELPGPERPPWDGPLPPNPRGPGGKAPWEEGPLPTPLPEGPGGSNPGDWLPKPEAPRELPLPATPPWGKDANILSKIAKLAAPLVKFAVPKFRPKPKPKFKPTIPYGTPAPKPPVSPQGPTGLKPPKRTAAVTNPAASGNPGSMPRKPSADRTVPEGGTPKHPGSFTKAERDAAASQMSKKEVQSLEAKALGATAAVVGGGKAYEALTDGDKKMEKKQSVDLFSNPPWVDNQNS